MEKISRCYKLLTGYVIDCFQDLQFDPIEALLTETYYLVDSGDYYQELFTFLMIFVIWACWNHMNCFSHSLAVTTEWISWLLHMRNPVSDLTWMFLQIPSSQISWHFFNLNETLSDNLSLIFSFMNSHISLNCETLCIIFSPNSVVPSIVWHLLKQLLVQLTCCNSFNALAAKLKEL